MTKEADLRAGAQSNRPSESGQKQVAPSEPPATQIKMPKQSGETPSPEPKPAQPSSMDAVENLLRNLMTRLEENDRRYGDALQGLNQRLNDLSEQVASARGSQSTGSGSALDRVHEQATSLAAQISDAGGTHQAQQGVQTGQLEQRVGGFANDDNPMPDFGDSRLNEDFANVTQRLGKSLASHAPASEFDALSQRMDELGQRFDTAISGQNNAEALCAIETQLKALNAGFGEARQNYARVEAIEDHLAKLMNWAQSGGLSAGSDNDRLDAIEKTLHALNENAQEMDARTVSTLEAMNEVLHSLAANSDRPQDTPPETKLTASEENTQPRSEQQPEHAGEPESDVWFEERPEPEPDTSSTDDRMAALEAEIGASIPDYQPSSRKTRQKPASETSERRVEPTFEAESDFIASARRAAAAAAAQEPPRSKGKPAGRLLDRLPGNAMPQASDDAAKPRRILYFIAASLLAVSAALLYARIKTETPAPQPAPPQQTAPQTSGSDSAPATPPENNSAPQAPDETAPPPKKKQSGRMPGAPSAPANQDRQTAHAVQPDIPADATERKATPPRKSRVELDPDEPLSTAAVLASLSPDKPSEQMPGVTVSIEEPEHSTPSPRAGNTARTAMPALVPPASEESGPDPLALPKRVPAPARKPAASTANVDSARAYEAAPVRSDSVSSGSMPPVRIGPNSLRLAAARGHPAAQVEIASRYAKGSGVPKDMKKATEWYGRAAAQGYAPAQYRLAALFERGQGVKKDIGVARTWYRRAAELGNVRAMHNLAVLYTRADGQKPDYVAARNWFSLAARYGLADSQFNMGILYESGLGTTKNIAEAYKWFTLAARQGDAEAAKHREALRPKLPARSLSAVEKTIRNWKAATPKEEANRTGAPRGGWQNAMLDSSPGVLDPSLIKRAQSLLNDLGYDAGVPDGKLGPQTKSAVRRFQQRSGATQTGILNGEVLQRLEALAS